MKKVRVYVGCGLTHAPKTFKKKIALFKDELRKIPWITVLDFVSPASGVDGSRPDPLGIYVNDIHKCVGRADALIGDITYASTGLGWELGTAVEKLSIRTMMCTKRNKIISNLPIGAARYKKNKRSLTFDEYGKSIIELLPYFIKELEKLRT